MLTGSPGPLRPTVARVSLSAIAANFRSLRAVAAPAEVCAVVKADAYGHGMGAVSRRLEREGCRIFAVGTVDEGLELRECGIASNVLLLQGSPPGIVPLLARERLTPVVSDLESLEGLGREAEAARLLLPLHLKFDTGMGRLGLSEDEVPCALDILRRHGRLRLQGLATHFARAAESQAATRLQITRFRGVLKAIADAGFSAGIVHAANSAALLSDRDSHFDCVRLGLALYGVLPEPGLPLAPHLEPALKWVSAVELVRQLPAGAPISYGGTYVTTRPTRVAVVPVGYADGYRRALGNRGKVLLRGRRAPVIGRVTMDIALVDVTDTPGAVRGDEVVLIGSQGGDAITAVEMAGWLDTIPYEVLCCVGARVPRRAEEDS